MSTRPAGKQLGLLRLALADDGPQLLGDVVQRYAFPRNASAIHLVLKWSPQIRPDTIERHREVAEQQGAVWWGRLGTKGSTGLAERWLKKLQEQLQHGSTTYVFLHRGR